MIGHGGNIYAMAKTLGCDPSDIIDMSSNVNPMGPPSGLIDFLKEKMDAVTALPEADSRLSATRFADYAGIAPERVLAGNGSSQFIYSAPLCLKAKNALIAGPTYSDYEDACRLHGVHVMFAHSRASKQFVPDFDRLSRQAESADVIFICNPNNPTGVLIPRDRLLAFCKSRPNSVFVIDESYMSFADDGENQSLADANLDNVVVLVSISKIFKMPGLRVGFVVSTPETIEKFKNHIPPWNMNSLAQAAVIHIADEKEAMDRFTLNTRLFLNRQKKMFLTALKTDASLTLYPGVASFMLIRLPLWISAGELCAKLAKEKILIRNCENFSGLDASFIRISFKEETSNLMLADRFNRLIQPPG